MTQYHTFIWLCLLTVVIIAINLGARDIRQDLNALEADYLSERMKIIERLEALEK